MLIDLSCPLELRGFDILHDDKGNVRAYLRLYNLSEHRVSHFEATILWIDSRSGTHEQSAFRADQLRGGARSAFTVPVSSDALPEADRVELIFTRVEYEAIQQAWLGKPARLKEIPAAAPSEGRELNRLAAAAGPDAVNFPVKADDHWVCVCGRPNAARKDTCARCLRKRDQVLRDFDRPHVLSMEIKEVAAQPIDIPFREVVATPADGPSHPLTPAQKQLRRRTMLMRRAITASVLTLLLLLVAFAFQFLTERQQIAREIRPPMRTEQTPKPTGSRSMPG